MTTGEKITATIGGLLAIAIMMIVFARPTTPVGCAYMPTIDVANQMEQIHAGVRPQSDLLRLANCMRGMPADGNGPITAARSETVRGVVR